MLSRYVVCALALLDPAQPTDDKPVTTSAHLALDAYSSRPGRVALDDEPTTELRVQQIWISMRDVGFRPVADCKGTSKAQLPGPISAELVRRKVFGMIDRFAIQATTYCAVELTLRRSRARTDGVPADLRGASLVVRGVRTDGVRVVVRSRSTNTMRLAALDGRGFELPSDGFDLVLAPDVAVWFEHVDLATADVTVVDGVQTVLIDERSNEPVLRELERSFPMALGVFRDDDRDGRAGARERQSPLVGGTKHDR